MLHQKEIARLRENAKVHKEVFAAVKKALVPGATGGEIDAIAKKICEKHKVLSAFKGFHGYPSYSCINLNDVLVHGVPTDTMIFMEGDLVTFDFGVKDTEYGVHTDAAFSIVVGGDETNIVAANMIAANKKALEAGVKMCRAGNRVGDVGAVISAEIEDAGFHIVKDLTGHGLGKTLHEKPYMYNYGKPGTGDVLKKGMLLAIEPIIGETSGKIKEKGGWEIYTKDGGLGCQYEHTILITDGDPEIIV